MFETFLVTINQWIGSGVALAVLGCFLWGMVSALLSPCHIASIPLIVAYVGGQERAVYNLMYRDTDTKRPVKIARPAPTTGPVREVFEYWVSRMGKNKRTILDNKRRDAVKRALKALSLDECKLAIEGCHATPHNMGVNPTGVCYNDLTLIFRDASHWERFIETATKAGRRPVAAKDAEPEPEVPRLSPEEQQAINLAGIQKLAQAIGRPGSR